MADEPIRATAASTPAGRPQAYAHIEQMLARAECVVLDGATGTELPRVGDVPKILEESEGLWGTRALVEAPEAVRDLHRRYVAAECDVISTNTWGLPSALLEDGPRRWRSTHPVHWMDVARRGVRVAREAVRSQGRAGPCAVAFSVNADFDAPASHDTVGLLSRVFAEDPPDVVLFETLSLVRPSLFAAVEGLLASGVPVWLSFRRCRHGLCGVGCAASSGSTGEARRRRVRASGAAVRGDGRRCVADQLHPARPCRWDAVVPARLHRSAVWGVSEPGVLHRRRLAVRSWRGRSGVRRDGRAVAGRGGADRWRVLQGWGPSTSRPRASSWPARRRARCGASR